MSALYKVLWVIMVGLQAVVLLAVVPELSWPRTSLFFVLCLVTVPILAHEKEEA